MFNLYRDRTRLAYHLLLLGEINDKNVLSAYNIARRLDIHKVIQNMDVERRFKILETSLHLNTKGLVKMDGAGFKITTKGEFYLLIRNPVFQFVGAICAIVGILLTVLLLK